MSHRDKAAMSQLEAGDTKAAGWQDVEKGSLKATPY